jgi:hypothetical protein
LKQFYKEETHLNDKNKKKRREKGEMRIEKKKRDEK